MSPEDVPTGWVEVAAAVLRDSRLVNVCGDGRGCRCEEAVEYSLVSAHDMLAAVLPEAMAEAWDEGKEALAAAILPDAAPLINPYREGSPS